MQYQKVDSSNIAALAHEGDVLGVKFNNGTEYHYQGVSSSTFEKVMGAASVGRTFNELIKSKPNDYPFDRVA
ncbi:KTSC domain-containing protein [Epibacterium sp. MM17-32]|uniref:KTSC domain-containing protein n=1 Tax=Epibacterium sp. MM17-32 TaxID=2917734 RepID=UPI001EF5AD68|nr:KTSC domain-containing protein [Epibacterium sp. MM17-32]